MFLTTFTLFLSGTWLNEGVLSGGFSRLFRLLIDQKVSVAKMVVLGWKVGGNGRRCRRRLFAGKNSWF